MAAVETPIISTFDVLENASGSAVRLAESRPYILSVSEAQADHIALRHIVAKTEWRVDVAYTVTQAVEKLRCISAVVIFSECLLPDGTWKDVLDLTLQLDRPPLLVVTSTLADDLLWSEVLNLGGYDVLLKPLSEEEVRRLLVSVWTHHAHTRPYGRALPAAS